VRRAHRKNFFPHPFFDGKDVGWTRESASTNSLSCRTAIRHPECMVRRAHRNKKALSRTFLSRQRKGTPKGAAVKVGSLDSNAPDSLAGHMCAVVSNELGDRSSVIRFISPNYELPTPNCSAPRCPLPTPNCIRARLIAYIAKLC